MADIWLGWGKDFLVSARGGLVIAEGDDEARQRLMRRLFTAVNGYIWHPEYGAGLPQKIGDPWTPSDIEAICRAQIALEQAVAINPPPIVNVTAGPNVPGLVSIDVQYTSALTGQSVQFNITM